MEKKIDIIQESFSQLRISGLTADPSPADISAALDDLESMMSEYEARNIDVDYNFESTPSIDSNHNLPASVIHGVVTNLAVRLMPDYGKGKRPDPSLLRQARQSYAYMLSLNAKIRQTQYPTRTPRGEAQRLRGGYRGYAHYVPRKNPPQNSDTKTIFMDDIIDFKEERFADLLGPGQFILRINTSASTGLNVTNVTLDGNFITYRVSPTVNNQGGDEFLRVVFTATINDSREISFATEFVVQERPITEVRQRFTLNDITITGRDTIPISGTQTYTVTFVTPKDDFNVNQIVVSNGTVSNFVTESTTVYTFDYTAPVLIEEIRLSVFRPEASITLTINSVPIPFMITGPGATTRVHQDTYTITFDNDADFLTLPFVQSAIQVQNGFINLPARKISDTVFEADITSGPNEGTMIISLVGNVIQGAAKSIEIVLVTVEIISPDSIPPAQESSFFLTFNLQTNLIDADFVAANLVLTDATLTGGVTAVSATTYEANVTPDAGVRSITLDFENDLVEPIDATTVPVT